MAVLAFSPAAGQAACRPLGRQRSLGRRELQLSFVQEPCPHTLFCVLFASAEPGLLGVVDKEKEMNNLYFTFSQGLPTGLLSRKNIPGYSLSVRACARSNPLSPLHTGILPRQTHQAEGLDYCLFIQSLEKGMLSVIHG